MKKAVEVAEMVDSGLCSTCKHVNGCMYRETFKGKILQCEEFDVELFNDMSNQVVNKKESKATAESNSTIGLCVNCDVRKTCTLQLSEKEVWFCREYV